MKNAFIKNFAFATGICAAVAAVLSGGAAVLAGTASLAPIVVAGAAGALGMSGVLAFTNYIIAPLATFFVGVIAAFARAPLPEADKAADKGFACGTAFSAAISAICLVAGAQGAFNKTAEPAVAGQKNEAEELMEMLNTAQAECPKNAHLSEFYSNEFNVTVEANLITGRHIKIIVPCPEPSV